MYVFVLVCVACDWCLTDLTKQVIQLPLFLKAGSRLSSRHSDRSDKGRIVRFDTDVVRAHTQPIGRKISRTGPTGRRMSQTDASGRKISQTQLPGRRISRTKPPMFNKNSRQVSSLPMINAVAAQTYNQFIEVEKNPFDTGRLWFTIINYISRYWHTIIVTFWTGCYVRICLSFYYIMGWLCRRLHVTPGITDKPN